MNHQTISILGSGNIGHGAAVHFTRLGHTVYLANSRGPESLAETVLQLGPLAHAATPAEAVRHAAIVLLAVPWTARDATLRAAGGPEAFAGKIVIDAMNPYTEYPQVEDLGGKASSEVVAALLGSHVRLVKAFNTIQAATLANKGNIQAPLADRIALPICGDDAESKGTVTALVEAMGFAPVDVGRLASSHVQEPHQPLYDKDFTPIALAAELTRLGYHANS